ncbi:hypothetical protein N0V88_001448 [Collariella sp. IMI 366227]|nr:hypothetical protein N0V88_001448 [Collariella sp. IMI 366227]
MPEEDAGEEPMPSPSKLRPSLAERTMETLSRLPSSPSVKGRSAASFFDNGRKPPSRPGSRASRPGSSHQSEGSGAQSRTSRPGSSAGLDESVSSLRPQHAAYNPPLSPIEGTPLPLRNRRSINSLQAPSKNTPRPVRASMYGAPSNNLLSVPRARSPSPDRPAELSVPKSASKTPGPRLTKRPSATFKKPPIPTRTKPAADTPKKGSLASRGSSVASREGTYASSPSVTSASTGATSDSAEPGQTYKKASSALREQIAKAKAAKRAAAKQVSSSHPDAALGEGPQVPTDGDFDFGLANDPFNQHRDDKAQAKVIKSRLETARTSGRLNIAALGLREIPGDVLNMYNLDTIGSGGAWAESVDLTRFVAADNELEMISDAVFPDVDPQELAEQDDSQGNIFAGLETLDLHGNILVGLPMGLRRLSFLTSLNLSLNRLSNSCLEVVCQATSLKDLKLGGNLLYGALDPCFSQLQNLEILDLHGNNLSSLPDDFGNLSRLRILNLSENGFEALPFDILARLPLTELVARKNQLRGTLIPDTVDSLRSLQTLDVSSNQVVHVCSQGHSVAMPALNQLCVSLNRLQALPDTTSWIKLATLAADENSINAIPDGFTGLEQLRTADFSSNDIRIIPPEIGRMTNLTNLRLSGNPLRDKKFSSLSTDEIKTILAGRLAPPEEPSPSQRTASSTQDGYYTSAEGPAHSDTHSDLDDDFATPPPPPQPHPPAPLPNPTHHLAPQIRRRWEEREGVKTLKEAFPNLLVLLVASNHLVELEMEG